MLRAVVADLPGGPFLVGRGLRLRALARKGLLTFPGASAGAAPELSPHHPPPGPLRQLEKALTKLAKGTGRLPALPSWFSSFGDILLTSARVGFCVSIWFNSHLADFPPVSALGPTGQFFQIRKLNS